MVLQVEELPWICLQYLIYSVATSTVLKFVQLAEKLSDSILMAACVQFLTESDDRYYRRTMLSKLCYSLRTKYHVHLVGPCCDSCVIAEDQILSCFGSCTW